MLIHLNKENQPSNRNSKKCEEFEEGGAGVMARHTAAAKAFH